jgi:AraC-like DNA-binding protein
MGITFSLIQILLFLGAAQGFFLAFILVSTRQGNKKANRLLASILFIFCLNIVIHTISHRPYSFSVPHHEVIITLIFFLFGPLFFLYTNYLTAQRNQQKGQTYAHFIPFLVCLFLTIPFYSVSLDQEKLPVILEILAYLVVFHVMFYMGWTVKILIRHSRKIRESFSSLDKINLNWLRFLTIIFTLTWLAAIYFDSQIKSSHDWDYVWLLVSVLMYLIGYFGLRQPEVFSGVVESDFSLSKEEKKKYKKSALSDDAAEIYLDKLLKYMQDHKPYLNSNITLPELAQHISISIHHLSQVINDRLQQNFFEFINKYRVQEAKNLLTDPGKKYLTIAAIGYESGFNSNSSFNAVFKKYTGQTPSQYRKSRN